MRTHHYIENGWTVIELIMVIVIIAILAVLSIPRFENFNYIKLQGAVKRVVSDIRYTQQLSISRHDSYKIVFNAAGNSYEVRRVSDSSYAQDPFTRANLAVNFTTDAQYRGIDISDIPAPNFNGTTTLQFDWQGIPRDGNGTALTADGSVALNYRGNSHTIYVTPNTGRVRVQ